MFVITKEFHFSAAHVLAGLPDGHPCGRMHGHNYRVVLEFTGDVLDPAGMVRDYTALGWVRDWIDAHWDHRVLNDALELTTAEALARTLYDVVRPSEASLTAVTIHETPSTSATYWA